MILFLTKKILVDAIVGCGFISTSFASCVEKKGLVIWTGNQWCENWEWNREALMRLDRKILERLYKELSGAGRLMRNINLEWLP